MLSQKIFSFKIVYIFSYFPSGKLYLLILSSAVIGSCCFPNIISNIRFCKYLQYLQCDGKGLWHILNFEFIWLPVKMNILGLFLILRVGSSWLLATFDFRVHILTLMYKQSLPKKKKSNLYILGHLLPIICVATFFPHFALYFCFIFDLVYIYIGRLQTLLKLPWPNVSAFSILQISYL